MKIYDISQEVYSCCVYPGDPSPEKTVLSTTSEGICNLSAFSMCSHNGTHIDAPFHFFENGKTVDDIPLYKTVGPAYVSRFDGLLTGTDAADTVKKAKDISRDASLRLLFKGTSVISEEAARVFAEAGIFLVGNESQTVGPEKAPACVHRILLSKEIVLLEGIRLSDVPEGVYFLCAAPLLLGGSDGAPCRAVLVEIP